jgi:hypothetical protein
VTNTKPPRWAELALDLILKRRDRECIAGDLLEEYREVILPVRGRFLGHVWYLAQIASLMTAPQEGLVLGCVFGAWLFALVTVVVPFSGVSVRDMPASLFDPRTEYGGLLCLFVAAGFLAYQRTGTARAAIKAGAIASLVSAASILALVSLVFRFSWGPFVFVLLPIVVASGAFGGAIGGGLCRTVAAIRTTMHSVR